MKGGHGCIFSIFFPFFFGKRVVRLGYITHRIIYGSAIDLM